MTNDVQKQMTLSFNQVFPQNRPDYPREAHETFTEFLGLLKQVQTQPGAVLDPNHRISLNKLLASLAGEMLASLENALVNDVSEHLSKGENEAFSDSGIIELGAIVNDFGDILKQTARHIGTIALMAQGRTLDPTKSPEDQAREIAVSLNLESGE